MERASSEAARRPYWSGSRLTMGDYLAARRVDGGRFDVLWGRDEILLGAQAIAFIDSLVATGKFFAALKAVLRSQGLPITSAVRLPLAPVDEKKLVKPEHNSASD